MTKKVGETKKATAKKTVAKNPQLKALRGGSHKVNGTVYNFAEGDIITTNQTDFDSMKSLSFFEEV